MSIPDGEYNIDLSVLDHEIDSFGLRYGGVPNLNKDPMTLYDDSKNLILEGTSEADNSSVIFEGVGQVHNSKNPAMANYYLSMEDGGFKLGKLNRTIRVNKSRNNIKWAGLIRKWNSRRGATATAVGSGTGAGVGKDVFDDVVEISDSEFPDFEMEFEERELDIELGDTEEKEDEIKKERELMMMKEKQKQERKEQVVTQREKESRPKETRPQTRPEAGPKQAPSVRETTQKNTPRQTQRKTAGKRIGNVSGKKVATNRVSDKKVTANVPKAENEEKDEFGDLEDQLQEVLNSDSESEGESGVFTGPITVIESKPTRQPAKTSSTSGRRPTSLRALMGDRNDDLSSSEEE